MVFPIKPTCYDMAVELLPASVCTGHLTIRHRHAFVRKDNEIATEDGVIGTHNEQHIYLSVNLSASSGPSRHHATQPAFLVMNRRPTFLLNHQLLSHNKRQREDNLCTSVTHLLFLYHMATAAVLTPHDVPTTLNYLAFTLNGEPPYNFTYNPPPEGLPQSNIAVETINTVVHDIRGKEDTASLDITGFEFVQHSSEEKVFVDEEAIRTRYYKEVEELLKKHTGAKRVLIFDHTIR